jgi:hypothetical protein
MYCIEKGYYFLLSCSKGTGLFFLSCSKGMWIFLTRCDCGSLFYHGAKGCGFSFSHAANVDLLSVLHQMDMALLSVMQQKNVTLLCHAVNDSFFSKGQWLSVIQHTWFFFLSYRTGMGLFFLSCSINKVMHYSKQTQC